MITICPDCGQTYGGPGACSLCGGALQPVDDALLGQSIGPYRVTKLLGAGAMGRVYRAVQPAIGARVAVKVLSLEGHARRDGVERFFAEARAVNLIRHDGIVNIIDLATLPDGRPYIVMEYLDGAPLSTVLRQRGALPLGTLAQLMAEVLEALAAAHARGIIHRDLKPDNVWVTHTGRAKVLDFGIAKLDPSLSGQSSSTRSGAILGTPAYMSPEQAMAKPVDPRSDLYSVGILLYEGVAGAAPFTAPSLYEMMRMHLEDPPPRLSRPGLPPVYEAVIVKALEKDPARRFSGATEMAAALLAATKALPASEWESLRVNDAGHAPAPVTFSSPGRPRRTGLWLGVGAAVIGVGAAAAAVVATRGGDEEAPAVVPDAGETKIVAPPRGGPVELGSTGGSRGLAATQSIDAKPAPSPLLDGIAWLPEAARLARARLGDDVEMTMMYLPNVRPDGTSDFAATSYTVAQYHFRSPKKSQRGDAAIGAELPCLVQVFYTTYAGVQVQPRTDARCDAPLIGPPRCTPKQIWERALAGGAPSNAIATMVWNSASEQKKQWIFMIGTDGSTAKFYQDECR